MAIIFFQAAKNARSMHALVCHWLFFVLCLTQSLMAQALPQPSSPLPSRTQSSPLNQASSVQLALRTQAECPSNVILLSDLVEMKGSDAIVHQIADLPIAPAPRMGNQQMWSRESITKMLEFRGISAQAIRWQGAIECNVLRVDGQRTIRSDAISNAPSPTNVVPDVQSASFTNSTNPSNTSNDNNSVKDNREAIDKSQFTAPFTTPVTVTQAERIAADAISNYLQSKTNSNGRWIIRAKIPTEHAKVLSMRRQILGVAGGQPPWDGEQEFIFLIQGPSGEQSLSIQATVKLPEMVVAANRPLAKGYILKEEDLVWIPMPRGLPFGPADCFSSIETLVGQQLRRSMSTQQVLRQNEVGSPTVVHVGDIIAIEVVSGGVVVGTNGRAIEAGSIDDLIQVDVEPSRTRILARITGERTAEVIATGTRSAIGNAKKSNPKNTNARR